MTAVNEPILTTATEKVRPDFHRKRLLQTLAAGYVLVWIWAAIAPLHRADWLLENGLVFLFISLLLYTYRSFPLSDISYCAITLFLTLHAIGAHYTYSKVPIGFWFQEEFNFSRNHYDRVIHFAFGLLMAYPIREVFLRVANAKGFWAYYLPMDVTLAFSAVFEIGEAIVGVIVAPELGNAYLGTQGDVWDAQKDMACAAVGALVCMVTTAQFHVILNKRDRARSPLQPPLTSQVAA